ncbi:MAG: pilus assembly protein, partial [Deltaproteobacteria bacterium]|nr:pilus assembly protein [Deltaproteobacteria bacterium]
MNLPNSARNDDATRATISALERKILLQKSLHEITYQIHAAQNIKQIIVDLKDGILKLFDAAMITIYVAETKHYEIYSLFLSGSTLNEIRLPINNKSIAGFVANNKRSVNITDAYNEKELKAIHEELVFDRSWDQKSGIRT